MDTKTICLAVLSQSDATGYEIKGVFEEGPFSYFQDVSFGSIYPALNRALEDGLVSVTELPQAGRPGKKIYAITAAGRDALCDTLRKETAPDRVTCDFLFKALFSHLLGPVATNAMVDQRLAELNEHIDRPEGCGGGLEQLEPREAFVFGFGHAIHSAMRTYIEENRDKLLPADGDIGRTISTEAAD